MKKIIATLGLSVFLSTGFSLEKISSSSTSFTEITPKAIYGDNLEQLLKAVTGEDISLV